MDNWDYLILYIFFLLEKFEKGKKYVFNSYVVMWRK